MKCLKAVVLTLGLCGASPVAAQQLAIDQNFRFNQFNFDNFARIFVVWRPVIIDGKVAICGGYRSRGGGNFSNIARQALQDMRVDGPNGTIRRNLRYFRLLPREALSPRSSGTLTPCLVTQALGTDANLADYALRITPQRYDFDD